VGSDKLVSAGNQQESLSSRERKRWFLAGLVEGEGSVTLSIKRHPTAGFGVYIQPEFFIYQHKLRRSLLEMATEFFGAGRIRPKPGNPDVLVFSIVSCPVLKANVVPFLRSYADLSARCRDYELFCEAVELCVAGARHHRQGILRLVDIAYAMNMNGKQRRIRHEDLVDRILRGHTPDTS
jgi:LAGLIDADG endonuclease